MDQRRIVFIQHGDFAEATDRFHRGLDETYFQQKYSVDAVADLVKDGNAVSVICVTAGPYDRMLSNGVRGIGVPLAGKHHDSAELTSILSALSPTHLVLRVPIRPLIKWAIERGIEVLPILADSFQIGMHHWLRNRRLARILNDERIRWVANHNLNASRSLRQIGVHAEKIIPWDWPARQRPESVEPKSAASSPDCPSLMFVGVHKNVKGIGDVINVVAELRRRDCAARLTSVGTGDIAFFSQMAKDLGVGGDVEFTGRVGHAQLLTMMRDHDVVIVPSRHDYSEGLPFTIYDALSTRTPLIVSDHPMFRGKVEHEKSGLVFPATDITALANCVIRMVQDDELYRRCSNNAVEAFSRLECPAKWHNIVQRWLRNSEDDQKWLRSMTLSEHTYA